MKRRVSSFFAGFAAAVLLLALCTTALAASGKVSYNFANVAFKIGRASCRERVWYLV